MTTRLYWHNAANATSNLPTTKQSTQTTTGGASQSVNKTMDTTIGTSEASINVTGTGSGVYFTRFVSETLGQTSISANTWTITYGYADSADADGSIKIALYVWRPGTGKIATIFDSTITIVGMTVISKVAYKATFSGSAVASGINAGTDVLCMEFMVADVAPVSKTLYYDGTTVITTNATTVSSVASYIETPETLTLGVLPGIDATSTAKVVTNKIITLG